MPLHSSYQSMQCIVHITFDDVSYLLANKGTVIDTIALGTALPSGSENMDHEELALCYLVKQKLHFQRWFSFCIPETLDPACQQCVMQNDGSMQGPLTILDLTCVAYTDFIADHLYLYLLMVMFFSPTTR